MTFKQLKIGQRLRTYGKPGMKRVRIGSINAKVIPLGVAENPVRSQRSRSASKIWKLYINDPEKANYPGRDRHFYTCSAVNEKAAHEMAKAFIRRFFKPGRYTIETTCRK